MIASGGDIEAMTLTEYLDLAYAVVVDEHVRRGASLFDALDVTSEFAAGTKGERVATASGRESPKTGSGQTVEEMNNESFATLMGAMKNVQGGFG